MKFSTVLMVAGTLLLLIALPTLADWGEGIEQVGEMYFHNSYCQQDVHFIDDYLYSTSYFGIEIWDVSDPEAPELFRRIPMWQELTCPPVVKASDNDILITALGSELNILDISDRENPCFASSISGSSYDYWNPETEEMEEATVSFDEMILFDCYIISLSEGKYYTLIDIGNPFEPVIVDEFILEPDHYFDIGQLVLNGNQVVAFGWEKYGNDEIGLLTFEVIDNRLALVTAADFEGIHHPMSGIWGDAIAQDDIILYIDNLNDCLFGVDISDPENPDFLGRIADSPTFWMFNGATFDYSGDRLFAHSIANTVVYDVRNGFRNAQVLGSFPFDEDWDVSYWRRDSKMAVRNGGLIATVDAFYAMKMIDVSNPSSPETCFDSFNQPFPYLRTSADKITCRDGMIYCAGKGLASVISIDDPAEPVFVDTLSWGLSSNTLFIDETDRMIVWGLPGDYDRFFETVLDVYNVEDPSDPVFIEELDAEEQWYEFAGVYGTIGVEFAIQWVFHDLSDPTNIREILRLRNIAEDELLRYSSFIHEGRLYVSFYDDADARVLRIYNLDPVADPDNPSAPELIEEIDLRAMSDHLEGILEIQPDGDRIYALTGHPGNPNTREIAIFNEDMSELLGLPIVPDNSTFTVRDDIAYVAHGKTGISVYDFTEPDNAEPFAWYNTPGSANDIILVDDLIVVADDHSLQLLRLDDDDHFVDDSGTPLSFNISEVFPNPTNGMATISFTIDRTETIGFSLVDITGREVWSEKPSVYNTGTYHKAIELENLGSGVYFVSMTNSKGTKAQKLSLIR